MKSTSRAAVLTTPFALSTLVSSASLPSSPNDLAKRTSGYLSSCSLENLDPPYLTASCQDGITNLDMNTCLDNSNGYLIVESNGDFTSSCKNFKVSGSWFKAHCRDEEGKERKNNVNTDDFVGNDGGHLTC